MTLRMRDFLTNEDGASSAEYVLLLSIIVTGVILGAASFGASIGEAFIDAGGVLDAALETVLAGAD